MSAADLDPDAKALADVLLMPVAEAAPHIAIGVLIGLLELVASRHPEFVPTTADALIGSALRIAASQAASTRPAGASIH